MFDICPPVRDITKYYDVYIQRGKQQRQHHRPQEIVEMTSSACPPPPIGNIEYKNLIDLYCMKYKSPGCNKTMRAQIVMTIMSHFEGKGAHFFGTPVFNVDLGRSEWTKLDRKQVRTKVMKALNDKRNMMLRTPLARPSSSPSTTLTAYSLNPNNAVNIITPPRRKQLVRFSGPPERQNKDEVVVVPHEDHHPQQEQEPQFDTLHHPHHLVVERELCSMETCQEEVFLRSGTSSGAKTSLHHHEDTDDSYHHRHTSSTPNLLPIEQECNKNSCQKLNQQRNEESGGGYEPTYYNDTSLMPPVPPLHQIHSNFNTPTFDQEECYNMMEECCPRSWCPDELFTYPSRSPQMEPLNIKKSVEVSSGDDHVVDDDLNNPIPLFYDSKISYINPEDKSWCNELHQRLFQEENEHDDICKKENHSYHQYDGTMSLLTNSDDSGIQNVPRMDYDDNCYIRGTLCTFAEQVPV